jgi:hypothetical protein
VKLLKQVRRHSLDFRTLGPGKIDKGAGLTLNSGIQISYGTLEDKGNSAPKPQFAAISKANCSELLVTPTGFETLLPA